MQDFRVLLRVRFHECDALGIVFNARYADYVDVAVTEFFRHTFGGNNKLRERNLDNQVVNLTIDWTSSARFDDVVELRMKTQKVGTTSFTLVADISQHPAGTPVAKASITYVMVKPVGHQQYEKTPIPDDVRDLLLTGSPGITVDYSGQATKS